ncbi:MULTISPECIES: hypothetical protein [unclassified Caballeronia]|uniref:hypothetical protein n=1 Tax=unclassified Caballeronia TaxID=2646786 RepID=UPI00285E6348|nr:MULTISPECIES: hypothetical protein [unclassified Caballeronia]MDR5751221.1 hypothetical protein [Caballeronia sp. LZ024]MDR5844642.1 hypothetical protein [Caballeronia sp. LZ031]
MLALNNTSVGLSGVSPETAGVVADVPIASCAAPSPVAPVALVAQSGLSITLWDEITSPAPVVPGQAQTPPLPQPVPVPVPVDAGRDVGTVSA